MQLKAFAIILNRCGICISILPSAIKRHSVLKYHQLFRQISILPSAIKRNWSLIKFADSYLISILPSAIKRRATILSVP